MQHDHDHPAPPRPSSIHDHGGGTPVADASVRIARAGDAPAVGLVQATVWRDAYAATLSPRCWSAFEGHAFARVWRTSLASAQPRHEPLVACAGDQVVGFAAVGPSDDADADDGQGELLGSACTRRHAAPGTGHACSTPPSTPCAGGGSPG